MSQSTRHLQFEQILRRNRGRLAAIAGSYAAGETDDLLQEILMQIWRGLDSFRNDSSVDTWCYRVALNTAISWRRRTSRRSRRLPSESADVSQLPNGNTGDDDVDLLRTFLQTLSEIDRALVLMYMDDLSGTEMAKTLGLSEAAVRVRIHRIKRRLAEWNEGDR